MPEPEVIAYWLAWAGAICWIVCFTWMHRISSRQDALLEELREQGRRIERLSKEEHELIKEVHPTVGQISKELEDISSKVDDIPSKGG